MTKSTLTNEEIKEIIAGAKKLMERLLARELLAEREARGVPAAWQERWSGGEWSSCTKNMFDYMTANPEPIAEVRELFTAPPAPTAMDERAAFNEWSKDNFDGGYKLRLAAWLGWQARAAMLNHVADSNEKASDKPRLSPRRYADCVNMLQEMAIAYHGTGQLREMLNKVLSQYFEPDHPHTRLTQLSSGSKPVPNVSIIDEGNNKNKENE